MKISAIIALLSVFLLTACEKECQTCYFIEKDDNGTLVTEAEVGEFCGDEIEEKEDQTLYCIQGTCYFDCR